MKGLLLPLLFFLTSVVAVFAKEIIKKEDNIAGIPIPSDGLSNKQNINIQAHLKAQASSTFGVDLDTGYTGFKNEAKASITLEFVNHDGFSWSNGQRKNVIKNANGKIRGGITVKDFKLSNGNGLSLNGNDHSVVSLPYYNINQNIPGHSPIWQLVPAQVSPGTKTWTDPETNKRFDIQWRTKTGDQQNLSDPENQTFMVSYGDIIAYLHVNDFYIKVSTNPRIKSDNTLRYWSSPINGVTNSYYGKTENWFFGEDCLVGRRFFNSFGGLTIGYQKDNVFNIQGEIASMSHFDRNDKKNVGWGMNWINAYAYKASAKYWLNPNLRISINTTGGFGQKSWASAPVGQDSTHGLSPMVWDGRDDLLNMKGTNGAYTIGGEISYKSNFKWTNGHKMEFILGVDSLIDPFASEKTLYGKGYAYDPALHLKLSGSHGMNSTVAVAGSVRYMWPIKEGTYIMSSSDAANRSFYIDDDEDRTSGLTFGMSYARSLGLKRHDGKTNNHEFNKFYNDGANSLSFNFTVFEDEENGFFPGLGFAFGFEINDILKYGRKIDPVSGLATKRLLALNLATQGEISYAFPGTWLSPKGRIIPYLGAWYSPNAYSKISKNQYFYQKFEHRLYTKVGLLFKQVIPFTELSLNWESNNMLSQKDQWGVVSATLKIIYE